MEAQTLGLKSGDSRVAMAVKDCDRSNEVSRGLISVRYAG
jgi:hypothetical protein